MSQQPRQEQSRTPLVPFAYHSGEQTPVNIIKQDLAEKDLNIHFKLIIALGSAFTYLEKNKQLAHYSIQVRR